MLFFFFVWNAVYRQVLLSLPQLVEKVCFFKKVLVLNPYPQTPFPRKGAILLGLPPLDPVGGFAPATPFLSTIEVFRQTEQPQRFAVAVQIVEKVCFL